MYVAQRGFVLATFMNEGNRAEAQRAEFADRAAQMKKKLDEIHPLISVPAGRKLLVAFENDFSSWLDEYQTIVQLCQSGHPDEAQRHSFEKIAPLYRNMTSTGNQFVEVYREVLESDRQSAAHAYEQALWISFVSIPLLATLGTAVFFVIRGMTQSLQQAVSELYNGAEQVASAASQVSSSSQALAQGSSEQAASLEETSASTGEIDAMARKNLESSGATANLIAQSREQLVQVEHSLRQT